jgi:hypothetical protein
VIIVEAKSCSHATGSEIDFADPVRAESVHLLAMTQAK